MHHDTKLMCNFCCSITKSTQDIQWNANIKFSEGISIEKKTSGHDMECTQVLSIQLKKKRRKKQFKLFFSFGWHSMFGYRCKFIIWLILLLFCGYFECFGWSNTNNKITSDEKERKKHTDRFRLKMWNVRWLDAISNAWQCFESQNQNRQIVVDSKKAHYSDFIVVCHTIEYRIFAV